MTTHAKEVKNGERFKFGANWSRFLRTLTNERIKNAEASLINDLNEKSLKNKSLLDAGSGSGLFSLAARRLDAHVHSFDFDPQSVACTSLLKSKYFPNDSTWTVEAASILDREYLGKLPTFDIVYSWGVLHHTGAMWQALENATERVSPDGKLFIAIYNDQGWISSYWMFIKKMYVRHPMLQPIIILIHSPYLLCARYLMRLISGRKQLDRGMSLWHDMIDWVGGYPFEVATPRKIVTFCEQRGFQLRKIRTCGRRHGCNEFVFQKTPKES